MVLVSNATFSLEARRPRTMFLFASQRLARRRQTRFAAIIPYGQVNRNSGLRRVAVGSITAGCRIRSHVQCRFGAVQCSAVQWGEGEKESNFPPTSVPPASWSLFRSLNGIVAVTQGASWGDSVVAEERVKKVIMTTRLESRAKVPKPPQVGGVYRRSDPAVLRLCLRLDLERHQSVQSSPSRMVILDGKTSTSANSEKEWQKGTSR